MKDETDTFDPSKAYADQKPFANLPRYVVAVDHFINEVAPAAGWKPGVAELLLRGGYSRPIKCGQAIYTVRL